MDGARTRGHPAALAAVAAMIRARAAHAVLLVGPGGVGKTTLALDLAAGLLCAADDAGDRPCGACRPCRLVATGGHPDVHRLGPDGPGRQIVIGGSAAKARGVRDLISDLALLPVEGGARVAIVTSAQRMNEDAQAALLKTLEEPPAGVTIVLCADAEEPLLPTIRSRCARIRLGPVGTRDIEAILTAAGMADAPTAARLARVAGGRPGIAVAWAADPEALRRRDELSRVLLDLVAARPSARLATIRSAAATALALIDVVDPDSAGAGASAGAMPKARGRRRSAAGGAAADASDRADADPPEPSDAPDAAPVRTPAAARRRAAEIVVEIWTAIVRDLVLAGQGLPAAVRDPLLLEETVALARELDPADVLAFLDCLGLAAVRLAGNASPELVLEDLALAAPAARGRRGMTAA